MHEFEGWFQTGAGFDAQNSANLVTCPACDTTSLRRALMTPNLASPKRRNDNYAPPPNASPDIAPDVHAGMDTGEEVEANTDKAAAVSAPAMRVAVGQAIAELRQIQRKIRAESRDVGTDFANSVRKIHAGEAPRENIYGQSSAEEREELADEGIDVIAMPWLPPEH